MKKVQRPDLSHEKKLWRQGRRLVVGLDEAGRGPLAGPVTAAAVMVRQFSIFNFQFSKKSKIQNLELTDIRDSKKLSARRREEWYGFLTSHPDIKWSVGLASEKEIDRLNILAATKLAMKRALANLAIKPDQLLLDGNFLLEELSVSQTAVVRGDEKIVSCAAASIIAKVTRDRLMLRYHKKYPQYGFDHHKGYGTRQHFRAIKKHGPCVLHRRSFRGTK